MQKAHKDQLRTIVTTLRRTLAGYWDADDHAQRGDLDRALEGLGFETNGNLIALDALRAPTPAQERAHRVAAAQLAALGADATSDAKLAVRRAIIERAAYSWINRLLALRTMEARGLIEETVRPSYDGSSEALYILRASEPERTTGADGGWWAVLEDACKRLAQILPGLFALDDPDAALRPSTPALLAAIKLVGGEKKSAVSETADFSTETLFQDPDLIGWAYQFYQEEAKARVYAKLGRGGKVETRSEIAAATQLFTEPYMVQWLLQNSLGRSYHEAYPDSLLPAGWAYYIQPEAASDFGAFSRSAIDTTVVIDAEGNDLVTTDDHERPTPFPLDQLTFLDPCMGSGHILREAFDMFAAIYRERHPEMTADEIANRILSHHLHGIDIDPRAAQLAALTLVLRAWEFWAKETRVLAEPWFLTRTLHLATTPTGLDAGALERHLARHPADEPFRPLLSSLFTALAQAPLLGSLLRPGYHLDEAITAFKDQYKSGQLGLVGVDAERNALLTELAHYENRELKERLLEQISQSFREDMTQNDVGAALLGRAAVTGLHLLDLLERTYTVVVTNPPYMGSANMKDSLKNYVKHHYTSGKRDLYAAFILRCLKLVSHGGRVGMVILNTWTTQKSYKELRKNFLENYTLEAVIQLGRHAFSEADPPGYPHLFTVNQLFPSSLHAIISMMHPVSMDADEQDALLAANIRTKSYNLSKQKSLLTLPNTPLLLSVPGELLEQITNQKTLSFSFR